MAKDLEKTRKGWDGKPLNEKDQRFMDMREVAKYDSWLDQDGRIPKNMPKGKW